MIGNVAGWTPPFQLSLPQLIVLAVTFWFEMQTWNLWGRYLPRTLGIVVAVCLPSAIAWVVRRAGSRDAPSPGPRSATSPGCRRHGTAGCAAVRWGPPDRVTSVST